MKPLMLGLLALSLFVHCSPPPRFDPQARLARSADVAMKRGNAFIASHPHKSFGYLVRGYAHKLKGNLDSAVVDLDKAISIDTTSTYAYYHRAVSLSLLDESQKALADFDKAIYHSTEPARYYLSKALLLRSLRNYQDAAKVLSEGIRNTLDPQLLTAMGALLTCMGLNDSAEALFAEAMELSPSSSQIKFAQINHHVRVSEYEKAIAIMDPLIERYPLAEYYAIRGYIHSFQGDSSRSIMNFDTSVSEECQTTYPFLLYSEYCISRGNLSKAASLLSKSKDCPKTLGDEGVYAFLSAIVARAHGDSATKHIETVMEFFARDVRVYFPFDRLHAWLESSEAIDEDTRQELLSLLTKIAVRSDVSCLTERKRTPDKQKAPASQSAGHKKPT